MSVLATIRDRLFPAQARLREELDAARAEYAQAIRDRQASREQVAKEAAEINEALDAALEAVVRAAEDISSIAPPRNDDGPQGTE